MPLRLAPPEALDDSQRHAQGRLQLKLAAVREWMVLVILLAIGVLGRLLFRDIANFTPIVGVAVFAGLYFSRPALALLAPIAVMVLSNVGLQAYGDWDMLVVVYASLLFPVVLSRVLGKTGRPRRHLRPVGMLACGVLPSVFFFTTTNFVVWFSGSPSSTGEPYASTFAGLIHCYVQAIPFYPYSLVGDLIFVAVGIFSYEMIVYFDRAKQSMAIES